MSDVARRPKLRPIEAVPDPGAEGRITIRDPSGLSAHQLTVSEPTAFVLSRMDGLHDLPDLQVAFIRRFGRLLLSDEIERLVDMLERALFLEGPALDRHVEALSREYRAAPFRPMTIAFPGQAPPRDYLNAILADGYAATARRGTLAGFAAPHLDYERGRPCYAAAYRDLPAHTDARRFVVLGTNHFGTTGAVVGTRKDFETPFGPVPCDREFMGRLDAALGCDLCAGELDHRREHSVELQVHLLRHVLRDREFSIVPFLCPDPCGPTGTRPRDGRGPDLGAFAAALARLIADDPTPTCVIAAADLSHVGAYFHDRTPLDAESLARVEEYDRALLACVERGGAEDLRRAVADAGNATNICSVGCLFAAAVALQGRGRAVLRRYHQAVTREAHNCVTCAAVDFTVD